MADFQYVDIGGKVQTVTANDAASAMKSAPNIANNSGVIAAPNVLSPTTTTAVGGAATGTTSGITSSSGTARTNEATMGKTITDMSAPTYVAPTNNTAYLDSYAKMLESNFGTGNATINTSYDEQTNKLADAQNRENGSTGAQVARLGGYLGNSGSGMGVMANLEATHRTELASLEAKRQAALQAAREGYADKSFAITQARLAEAKGYEQEAYNRQQKFFDQSQTYLSAQNKIKNEEAIGEALKGGAASSLEIFNKLKGIVPMADISTYLKNAATNSGGAGFAFSAAELPKVLGAGLSVKDVKEAEAYINQHGYTSDFRATLTPRQRTAFDAVFYPKATSTGTSSGQTIKDGSLIYTPQDHLEDSRALEASRGQDTHADPTVYYHLYQTWMSHGGTVQGFLKEYPPAYYVNPENNWLPGYLLPKAPAGGSTVTFDASSIP